MTKTTLNHPAYYPSPDDRDHPSSAEFDRMQENDALFDLAKASLDYLIDIHPIVITLLDTAAKDIAKDLNLTSNDRAVMLIEKSIMATAVGLGHYLRTLDNGGDN